MKKGPFYIEELVLSDVGSVFSLSLWIPLVEDVVVGYWHSLFLLRNKWLIFTTFLFLYFPFRHLWQCSVITSLTFSLQQYLSFSRLRKPSSSSSSLLSSSMSGFRDRLPMILSLSRWNETHLTTFHAAALCRHWGMPGTACGASDHAERRKKSGSEGSTRICEDIWKKKILNVYK